VSWRVNSFIVVFSLVSSVGGGKGTRKGGLLLFALSHPHCYTLSDRLSSCQALPLSARCERVEPSPPLSPFPPPPLVSLFRLERTTRQPTQNTLSYYLHPYAKHPLPHSPFPRPHLVVLIKPSHACGREQGEWGLLTHLPDPSAPSASVLTSSAPFLFILS
jgi:hypothetical protein